jgi:hypothetical protein
MPLRLWALGAVALVVAALAGWVWVERSAAASLRERAVAAERAASDARAAAVANAAAALWQREAAEAAGRRAAELEAARGEARTRTVTVVREIRRASDAYQPVGPALRLAARRLRELDAAARPAPGADPAAAAGRAPGDPRPPPPAR